MKVIKVDVSDIDGSFDVDLTGYHGIGCDAIIEAFGEIGEIKTHIHKAEYRQTVNVTRKVSAKQ